MQSRSRLLSIDRIVIREPSFSDRKFVATYYVDGEEVELEAKYDLPLKPNKQDMRVMAIAPLVNYSLFTDQIEADFNLTKADLDFIKKMMVINSREVYVNKLLFRQEFFNSDAIPENPNIEEASYSPSVKIGVEENERVEVKRNGSVAVMSSGGKDSLLTYGLMHEVGANVFPIFINESGGHWRTAVTAYNYFKVNDTNTLRVWTTIDRFYKKLNSKVSALNERALKMWSDTYPIQLFIFPVYILLSLPYINNYGISAVLKGDEFDDPRGFHPASGIPHFNGIYDQTQQFDIEMTNYFKKIGYGVKFYSVLRGITGLVEERILFQRYPHLALLQRSCHSCHIEDRSIVPCGKCSKCNGVLLFLMANSINPELLNYKREDIEDFKKNYENKLFRLDEDEKQHALYIISGGNSGALKEHVEKIHEDPEWCDPDMIDERWRDSVMKIVSEYTKGKTRLENGEWT
ncbi:MAG: hypothetical protein QXT54_00975 [Thermoplasmatales archaeon]